jgi:Domain of unknown function (DUF4410)
MNIQRLPALVLSVLLAACGSSSQIRQPIEQATAATAKFAVSAPVNAVAREGDQPPEHFLAAVASYLKLDLEKSGRLAKDGDTPLTIEIKVVEYRMRTGFSRMMFGMLAGKDGIASEVTVRDAAGVVKGSAKVDSFNLMAIGGEEDVARMHGEEIAKTLLARLKAAEASGK